MMSSQVKALFVRVFRNTGYILGGRGFCAVLSLITTAVSARALGLQDYGVLLLINSFVLSCSAGLRFQSWQPLLQYGSSLYRNGDRHPFQMLLRHCMLLDGIGAVAGMGLALLLCEWFGNLLGWGDASSATPFWYMTVILFMNTGGAMGVMRLLDRYELSVLADSGSGLIRLVGSLAGLFWHWSFTSFLVIWYLSTAASFFINYGMGAYLLLRSDSLQNFRIFGVPWVSPIKGIWRFIFSVSINQALARLSSRLTVMIVGAVLGPQSAAIYNVTWQISDGLARPAQMMTPALYPELVALKDKRDWTSIRQVTHRILQVLGVFSAAVLAIVFVLGPWLLHVLLTVPWSGTRTLLLLMTLTAILDLWDVPLEPLLVSLNRAHQILLGRLFTMCVTLPLLYFLTSGLGMTGAGLATLIGELVIFLTRLVPYMLMSRKQDFGRGNG
ncbi:lipopolysaccharide biosynthesis protein [Acetobacter sp. AC2005]|uniref:lipopolysaccharide biosynthesis protein n=1 Tax=Acetobacter sp. AC2005 TaxID=3134142 RepID=UPI0030CE410C